MTAKERSRLAGLRRAYRLGLVAVWAAAILWWLFLSRPDTPGVGPPHSPVLGTALVSPPALLVYEFLTVAQEWWRRRQRKRDGDL